jgi:DNA-directed RNA polymerase subunit M/transcription elongation factor TFIIS
MKMIKFKGARDDGLGSIYCESCGSPMKSWEKMSTESNGKGQVYVFRCKKCKKRIEAFNDKA